MEEKYLFKEEINLECGAKVLVETKQDIFHYVYITVIDKDGSILLKKRSEGKLDWEECKGYYCKKINLLLQDYGTLSKPYVMIECGDRMYKVCDLDYTDNHRKLLRSLQPIGYFTEEPASVELFHFGGLHDIFVYEEGCLVFMFDEFYLNGESIGTFEEVKSLFSSRYDVEYSMVKAKAYFEQKFPNIKITSYETENASGGFGENE